MSNHKQSERVIYATAIGDNQHISATSALLELPCDPSCKLGDDEWKETYLAVCLDDNSHKQQWALLATTTSEP